MKNLKEFEQLIVRYESIEIDEIKKAFNLVDSPAMYLTGFGESDICTLCKAVKSAHFGHHCDDCVYGIKYGCNRFPMERSFEMIYESKTPNELLRAYRNRAKAMRKFANTINLKLSV